MSYFHPVSQEIIDSVMIRNVPRGSPDGSDEDIDTDLDPRIIYSDEIICLHEDLSEIQTVFEKNLRTIYSCSYTSEGTVSVVWQSPNYLVLGDEEGILFDGLDSEVEFNMSEELSQKAHSRVSKKILQKSKTEVDIDNLWTILTPSYWYYGVESVDTLLSSLIKQGLSPTQAIDYWMVNIQAKTVPNWAAERGKSAPAIRQNVRKAEELVSEQRQQDPHDPTHYFEPIYEGYTHNDREKVTVNGSRLHPWYDVYDYATSGHLKWGYKGAGATQLAAAILGDAVGQRDLSHDVITSFRDYLNQQIENDEWQISQSEVVEWFEKHSEKA